MWKFIAITNLYSLAILNICTYTFAVKIYCKISRQFCISFGSTPHIYFEVNGDLKHRCVSSKQKIGNRDSYSSLNGYAFLPFRAGSPQVNLLQSMSPHITISRLYRAGITQFVEYITTVGKQCWCLPHFDRRLELETSTSKAGCGFSHLKRCIGLQTTISSLFSQLCPVSYVKWGHSGRDYGRIKLYLRK